MPVYNSEIKIFNLYSENTMVEGVARILGTKLGLISVDKFKDGDTDINIGESVRGKDIYVFHSYVPPIGERIYELNEFIDAVKYGGGDPDRVKVNAVLPYLFGSRGERRVRARQSVPTLVVARGLVANGCSKVLTCAVHNDAIATAYNAVGLGFENLELEYLAADYIIKKYNGKEIGVVAPDVGAAKRCEKIIDIIKESNNLSATLVIGHKVRKKANEVERIQMIGNIKDLDLVMVDDIGDTLGTAYKATMAALEGENPARSVSLIMYHPVLGKGYEKNMENLLNSCDEIVFTNSIPLKKEILENKKIKIIPLEPLFAETIKRMNENKSISGLFKYAQIMEVYRKAGGLYREEKYVQIG